jgi:ABC-type transport system involved in multi-copper enzyme maturation permease subunit
MSKHYLPERFPLFWFELRRQWRAGGGIAVIAAAFILALIWYAYLVDNGKVIREALVLYGERRSLPELSGLWTVVKLIEIGLIVVLGPLVTTGSISRERERKTLDALVSTLHPAAITLQKYCGGIALPFSLFLFSTLGFGLLALFSSDMTAKIFFTDCAVILLTLLGGAGIGLLASCYARNFTAAQVWSFLVVTPIPLFIALRINEIIDPQYAEPDLRWYLFGYFVVMIGATIAAPLFVSLTLDTVRAGARKTRPAPTARAPLPPLLARLPLRRDYLPNRHPLLWFELRRRIRGDSGFLVLFGYLLALSVVLVAAALTFIEVSDPTEYAEFGRGLWITFTIAQAIFTILLSPGLTASAFSGEREGGTMDYLLMSPLTTRALLWGKLLGAMGQVLLLLCCSMPVVALIALAYGGISLPEILLAFLLQALAAAFFGCVGILASCHARQVSGGVVRAYLYMGLSLVCMAVCPPVGILVALFGFFILLAMARASIDRLRHDGTDEEYWRIQTYREYIARPARNAPPPYAAVPPPPPAYPTDERGGPPVLRR